MYEYKWQWFYNGEPTSQKYSVKGDYNSCRLVHDNMLNSYIRLKNGGLSSGMTLEHSLNEIKS